MKSTLTVLLFPFLFIIAIITNAQSEGVQRLVFTNADSYLIVEILADDLVHFESGIGDGSAAQDPLFHTPMVVAGQHKGASKFIHEGVEGAEYIETAELRLTIDAVSLCVEVATETAIPLTRICAADLDQRRTKLTLTPERTEHVYGLGEQFRTVNEANGDWVGTERKPGILGNVMEPFEGGAVGNAQFPVMYAVGQANYALFVDMLPKQTWEFIGDQWEMETLAVPLRWYVLAGDDLPDLRRDYMALTGLPPVPPKSAFGLWVSEYGYDDWAELDDKRRTLDENRFPQDGFVLDLQWFGGIETFNSQMGSLDWDFENFPAPAEKIAQLRNDEGLDIMVIEESYVDAGLPNFDQMAAGGYLVKSCATCEPATLRDWWGAGGMVDWTNTTGADLWHDVNRQHLIEAGVAGHWTDLGEPEMMAVGAWYVGLPNQNLHDEVHNHNLYNLLWSQSVARGYERNGVEQRPFIMSRSGTSGIQRYGAALWSGDIGANLGSLTTQMNAQMHIAFSGIDYFGSDIGGFHRNGLEGAELDDLYTVWFANSALLDVPVRPHTENLSNKKETAPDRVGNVASNLANIRQRYALAPYLYSLAHAANRTGDPVVPPLVFHFEEDVETRTLGNHKMLGDALLVRTVTEGLVEMTDVYLPAGRWVNYHTGQSIESIGEWFSGVAVMEDEVFRPPLFLREGAIVPHMFVDEQTMNLHGMRRDGSVRDELIVRVVPSAARATTFTLYEDDGRTIAYQSGAVRTTLLHQWQDNEAIAVLIGAADGTFAGASNERNNVVRVALGDVVVTGVRMNGEVLENLGTLAGWESAEFGYFLTNGELWAKSGSRFISEAKQFTIALQQPVAAESTVEPVVPPVVVDEALSGGRPIYLVVASLVLIVLLGAWLYRRRA